MMKVAVLALFLLIVAVAESQDDVAPLLPIDPIKPGMFCTLLSKSIFVTKGCCKGNITVGYCSGLCSSSSEYTPTLVKEAKCTCCKETGMIKRTTKLNCSEGLVADYTYITIAACSCVDTKCTLDEKPVDTTAQ